MEENYYNLIGVTNLENLSIVKKDSYSCILKDQLGVTYKGFKLAESPMREASTVCDLTFQKSTTDDKYQARMIFRKTDSVQITKTTSKNQVIISFSKGAEGYRELWLMISFLYKWRVLIELDEFEDYYSVTEENVSDTLKKISTLSNKQSVLNGLKDLPQESLEDFGNLVSISKLQNVLEVWEIEKENSLEEFWQNLFKEHSWVLSQIFASPLIQIKSKFYCGGKEDDDRGGVKGDFLYKNMLTNNIAFIEIKTPNERIVSTVYRGKEEGKENMIYGICDAVTAGVNQLLNQRKIYLKTFREENNNELNNSKCVLIVGTIPVNDDQRKSFELFRQSLREVEVYTFDEVFYRVKSLLEIVKS